MASRGPTGSIPEPTAEEVAAIRNRLRPWFAANRRALPWRETADPYAIWVAETMLQQTQVATVVPYFERWMARFPTVRALAEAPLEEVLRHWSGLGYYARARNLHQAARLVAERHGGVLPANAARLRALPGVGRYTAGAILSIALGVRAALVDGNVARVLSRVFLVEADPRRGSALRRLWALAEALVPDQDPGGFNQALMELGATICVPDTPRCTQCPLAGVCRAHAEGRQGEFPSPRLRPQVEHAVHVSAVVRQDRRVLIVQRPRQALWGGLWEFPRAVRQAGESLEDVACRAAREAVGLLVRPGTHLALVRHTVTHHRIALYALSAEVVGGTESALGCEAWEWAPLAEVDRRPLSAPQSRLLRALRVSGGC